MKPQPFLLLWLLLCFVSAQPHSHTAGSTVTRRIKKKQNVIVTAGGALEIVATKTPTCCWSKWGDAFSCGQYDGSGGQCNTDRSKSCSADSNCAEAPAAPTATESSTTNVPSTNTAAVVTKTPTCCWSKWGDASTCGQYDGSGGQCNTDRSKSCSADSNCPGAPAAPTATESSTTNLPSTTTAAVVTKTKSSTTNLPSTTTAAVVPTTKKCCWSKWGTASTCGQYDGSGGQCNTDRSKSCFANSNCPDAVVAAGVCPPELCSMCSKCMEREMQALEGANFQSICVDSPNRCSQSTWCRALMENRLRVCIHEWGLIWGTYPPEELTTCVTKILCKSTETASCDSWRAQHCSSSFMQRSDANSSTDEVDNESSRGQQSSIQAAMYGSMAKRSKSKSETHDAEWAARSLDASGVEKCD